MLRDEINHLAYFKSLMLKILALGFIMLFNAMGVAATPSIPLETTIQAKQLSNYAVNTGRATARSIPNGGSLRVAGINLDKAQTTDLVLERFEVFSPDAQIIVDGAADPIAAPTDVYFRGSTSSMPQAMVVLVVPERGAVRGLITDKSDVWVIDGASGTSGLSLSNRKVDVKAESADRAPFKCGAEHLEKIPNKALPDSIWTDKLDLKLAANVAYTARIAIETDYEFFAKFGNETAALQYIGDLIAFVSIVYEREINTNLIISYTKLWPNGAGSDPWSATNTSSALDNLTAYWKANNTAVNRTTTHMLSGKDMGGGLAYGGVLCDNDWGFGVSADISGQFNINAPEIIWDVIVVAHELGHNFNSLHTHGYCNIGGVADPVDLCYPGEDDCQGLGKQGLPGVNSLTGGTAGTGTGTLMSYCHLLDGWNANLSYTFGLNHTYGIDAQRVPAVMRSHVQNTAAANPTCLVLQGGGGVTAPTAVTNPATNITANTAALKGTVTPNGASTTVTFDFGTTTAYGTSVAAIPATINATAAATAVTANKTGLICNTTYNYRVKAVNSAGSTSGANVSFKTAACPVPIAPSNLVATVASSTQINLSWRDNSSNETGFKIERKTGATGVWAQIGTVAANVVSFSNTGLVRAVPYFYRVRAYNAAANSGYSNQIGATTANCTSATTALAVPGSATGTLATTDCKSGLRTSSYYDNFSFVAVAGKQYTITLNSAAFNTFVYLRNSANTVLASNDNGNGGTNAKIVYTPTVAGTLTIHATSFAANAVGAYTVTIAVAGGAVVLFNNGFEVSTDWNATTVSGTSGAWYPVTASTDPDTMPHGGSKFEIFNSHDADVGDSARLYRATGFAVASSYTTVTLKFWMYHDNGYSTENDRIQVQVSTNNGTDWVNVGLPIARYATTNGWTQTTINLSAYKGKTVNLGFLGIADYGNDMAIDDVTVTAQ